MTTFTKAEVPVEEVDQHQVLEDVFAGVPITSVRIAGFSFTTSVGANPLFHHQLPGPHHYPPC